MHAIVSSAHSLCDKENFVRPTVANAPRRAQPIKRAARAEHHDAEFIRFPFAHEFFSLLSFTVSSAFSAYHRSLRMQKISERQKPRATRWSRGVNFGAFHSMKTGSRLYWFIVFCFLTTCHWLSAQSQEQARRVFPHPCHTDYPPSLPFQFSCGMRPRPPM